MTDRIDPCDDEFDTGPIPPDSPLFAWVRMAPKGLIVQPMPDAGPVEWSVDGGVWFTVAEGEPIPDAVRFGRDGRQMWKLRPDLP